MSVYVFGYQMAVQFVRGVFSAIVDGFSYKFINLFNTCILPMPYILSHSDCSVIYLKQNVTPKYYIQNKSTFYLSSNIKYEACNVMKRSPHLVIQ